MSFKHQMKKLKLFIVPIGIIAIGLVSIRAYNERKFHIEKETRFMMDTYVTIYAVGDKDIASKAISLALGRMQEVGVKFNSLDPKSPIYAFNQKGIPIYDAEILELIKSALKVSRESDGAFDITVAPLVELWGFYKKSPSLAQDKEIKAVLKNVGYQHLSLNNGKLEKDNAATRIDLGGIAKGYAISQAIKVLRQEGVASALIDAGGDVYALGRKGKKLWKVGLRDPRKDAILGYVEVEGLAVMGSGDYERFFIQHGERYHHIFNPKTGYPTEGVAGVTLIYSDPVLAQAWAKIPFVMGPKKGLEFLEKIPGVEAMVVTASGETLYTPGLNHTLKFIPQR